MQESKNCIIKFGAIYLCSKNSELNGGENINKKQRHLWKTGIKTMYSVFWYVACVTCQNCKLRKGQSQTFNVGLCSTTFKGQNTNLFTILCT